MGNRSKKLNLATGLKNGPARVAEKHADKAKKRAEKAKRWEQIMGK